MIPIRKAGIYAFKVGRIVGAGGKGDERISRGQVTEV